MSKTLLATLAAFGTALGGCGLASVQHAPASSAEAPAPRAVASALAQALIGDRPVENSEQALTAPDRLSASYRALTQHLETR